MVETVIQPTKEELAAESNTDRMIREKMERKAKGNPGAQGAASPADNAGKSKEELENEQSTAAAADKLEKERLEGLTPEQRELEEKAKKKDVEDAAAAEALEKENQGKSPEEIQAEKEKSEKSKKKKEKALAVDITPIYKEEEGSASGKAKEDEGGQGEVAPEIKNKIAIADEVMSDEFLKGYLEVKKSGGDVNEYLNGTKQVDYNKLTPEEIITIDCKNRGIVDPKAIELEIDSFNELTPRKKDIELSEIKESLIAKDKKEKARLGLTIGEGAKRNNAIVQKFQSEVPELIDGLIGKPIEGHKELTKSDAELLKKAMLNPKFTRPDGTFNTGYLAQIHARALFYEGDLKTAKADGYTLGFDQAMEEVTRPSKDGNAGRSTGAQKPKTKAETIREGIGKQD